MLAVSGLQELVPAVAGLPIAILAKTISEILKKPPTDLAYMRRQLHAGCRQRLDGRAESRECVDERMNSPAAFQVARYRHFKILDRFVLLFEREQIAQRLRRMFMTSVPAIDDRKETVLLRLGAGHK